MREYFKRLPAYAVSKARHKSLKNKGSLVDDGEEMGSPEDTAQFRAVLKVVCASFLFFFLVILFQDMLKPIGAAFEGYQATLDKKLAKKDVDNGLIYSLLREEN